MCLAASASAKLRETIPQLIERFGKVYTIESDPNVRVWLRLSDTAVVYEAILRQPALFSLKKPTEPNSK
jgi:hypothetical protein